MESLTRYSDLHCVDMLSLDLSTLFGTIAYVPSTVLPITVWCSDIPGRCFKTLLLERSANGLGLRGGGDRELQFVSASFVGS